MYSLWNIIKKDDELVYNLVGEIKDEEDYEEHEYPILKNNNRAKKLLYHALDKCEMKKIGTNKSAKSIWDAERYYFGNQDLKRNCVSIPSIDCNIRNDEKDMLVTLRDLETQKEEKKSNNGACLMEFQDYSSEKIHESNYYSKISKFNLIIAFINLTS